MSTCAAWTHNARLGVHRESPLLKSSFFEISRPYSCSSLMATVAPEGTSSSAALTPKGKPVAEGQIVASFKGGLVAVRVDDDSIDPSRQTPEVIDMTKTLPKASKSSSLGT